MLRTSNYEKFVDLATACTYFNASLASKMDFLLQKQKSVATFVHQALGDMWQRMSHHHLFHQVLGIFSPRVTQHLAQEGCQALFYKRKSTLVAQVR